MPLAQNEKPGSGIYTELQSRIGEGDKEGAIEAYYQLLSSGAKLSEIIAKIPAIRVDSANNVNELPLKQGVIFQMGEEFSAGTKTQRRSRALSIGSAAIGCLACLGLISVFVIDNTTPQDASVVSVVRNAYEFVFFRRSNAVVRSTGIEGQPAYPISSGEPQATIFLSNQAKVSAITDGEMSSSGTGDVANELAGGPANSIHPKDEVVSKLQEVVALGAADAAPKPPAATVSVTTSSPIGADSSASDGKLSGPVLVDAEVLMHRADALIGFGDISSARLFYERAAVQGNSEAALRLGEMFDPGFLRGAGFGYVSGDVDLASYWYQRAYELGNKEAGQLIQKTK